MRPAMENINATLPRGPFPPAPRISMLSAVAGADVEIFGTSTRPGLTFNIEIWGAGGQGPSCVYSFHRGLLLLPVWMPQVQHMATQREREREREREMTRPRQGGVPAPLYPILKRQQLLPTVTEKWHGRDKGCSSPSLPYSQEPAASAHFDGEMARTRQGSVPAPLYPILRRLLKSL